MALSWNEIKDRALKFSAEWEGETRERAEKDSFWNDFFHVFGISRRRLATFEEPVKKLSGHKGFIDLFWKGTLLVEHKSQGKDLDAAFTQATDYFHGIKEHELPQYVLVSDFERFKLYDLDTSQEYEFTLKDFHKNIKLFGFVAGYQKRTFKEEDPVNIKAAELMGKLHDELEQTGYEGHPLEVMLVRLLFCLFADDTGIFEKDTFKEFLEVKTNEDGSDLGAWLAQFFQVLNTPRDKRLKSLDEHLNAFPYVNGKLFEEPLPISSFNSSMREILLQCCVLDWGKISPAIFGSMFQSVMDPQERRNLGAHYTSEKNIMKLIKPLFLDDLHEEFERVKANKNKLRQFHGKLGQLKFLDPACGCGNFLIITYRELRLLELEVLKVLYKMDRSDMQGALGIDHILLVDVDQFFGIEYDEFPARIAEVALWLMDHQMNLVVSEAFGLYYARLPLRKSATIVNDNALQIDWNRIVNKKELNYILGNPPFYGKQFLSELQRQDMRHVFKGVSGYGVLDYVAAWYLLAAKFANETSIEIGYVSTNSISQGEQTGILWHEILSLGYNLNFAHRTFNWKNEARGKAAVHVIIIGFSQINRSKKSLWFYDNIDGEPVEQRVGNINPYLIDGPSVVIKKRREPICSVPKISFGSMPNDGGNFLLLKDEKEEILRAEPELSSYIKPFLGAQEFINNKDKFCIWLRDASPAVIRSSKILASKVEAVRTLRLASNRSATRELAKTPSLFGEIRQPESHFILIPRVSSERRLYIPIGFFDKDYIAGDTCLIVSGGGLYEFGILNSKMHMTWVNYTCGRLKSDYRYSNEIVYNNYPWPKSTSEKNKKAVETKAQKVLDVRAQFPDSSLADLYDPLTMPPTLVKAHQELDKAVDLCYRPQSFTNEAARIAFLFELYAEYTEPLLKMDKKVNGKLKK